jgi:hypothetical protein
MVYLAIQEAVNRAAFVLGVDEKTSTTLLGK